MPDKRADHLPHPRAPDRLRQRVPAPGPGRHRDPRRQAQNTPSGAFAGSGTCFYWLHTHAADGVIHIESPVKRTYTLGDFFNVWGQPFGPRQVGPATGPVVAIYNGQRYMGSPGDIPLNGHAQIQLDVGRPLVAPQTITFPGSL
jgi:hypothetical protein